MKNSFTYFSDSVEFRASFPNGHVTVRGHGWKSHDSKDKMVAVQGAVANGLSAVICLVFCVSFSLAGGTNYLIGAGIADVTGPAADVDMVSCFYLNLILITALLKSLHPLLLSDICGKL